MESIKNLIEENKKCSVCDCSLNGNCCRDCRHMEMSNDQYNDGTRRCSYKGRWLSPSTPACAYFQP